MGFYAVICGVDVKWDEMENLGFGGGFVCAEL